MEETLTNLRLPTSQLQLEHFQATLNLAQKIKKNVLSYEALSLFVNEASELLWNHLKAILPTTECQLICATSFFTLMTLHEDLEKYLDYVGEILSNHYTAKAEEKCISRSDTLITISLIYGLYQSPFITSVKKHRVTESIFEHSFDILIISSYDYSEFTFITFKTLQSLRKLLHSNLNNILLTNQKHTMLLKVTSHNWENPITGVRDLNKLIFGLYLDMSSYMNVIDYNYTRLMSEINSFPWNKAKYLMLSEIVAREVKSAASLFESNPDWLNGLMKSLTTTSLVSAGADMYFAVLKKTHSDTEWCNIFLDAVLNILNGSEFKTSENFNNYWCMNTLKQFPKVLEILTDILDSMGSRNATYAYLSVLRQGNKTGSLKKNWLAGQTSSDKFISNIVDKDETSFAEKIRLGLEHVDVNIRIQTFEILCIAHNNALPTEVELQFILNFLQENVNSDSTVLRLTMLNNLKLFSTRLHISTMNNIKHKSKEDTLQHVRRFCASLQIFLHENLRLQGNYQRNITTMKLCQNVLSSFGKPLQRKRRPNIASTNEFTLKQWLIENEIWFLNNEDFSECLLKFVDDPSDDVRETVSEILLSNYTAYINAPGRIENLLERSLKSIRSKFFYEVSRGHCGMRLISHLLVEFESSNLKFNTIEKLFQYFFKDFISEMDHKNDILTSIELGKPLHSLICALQNILEVCLLKSHPLQQILTTDVKKVLVEKLIEIPKYYTLEEGTACSPDFSEMSDMVEQLISQSSCKLTVEDSDVKISDLHQMVLNCVWLNLKACCDLLCLLVKCTDQDVDSEQCDICLHVMTNVLETSRHKGAIEAAGVALGKSIKHLTSLPNHLTVSRLPMKLLKGKLEDLIFENEMGSTTRRGAGLSIMLHRIVSNDMDKEKPLFHYAINMLLKASSTMESEIKGDIGNEKDIPKAIYIHLMTKMVADSSLASDVMYYSASLAEVAFGNLTSEQWQIRNAALQLYGALVPKLIGQKKAASSDEDSAATVASDELRTHSSKLWAYIEKQLDSQNNYDDIVQTHSNLVPTLNILASTAKRYNFFIDSNEHIESEVRLFMNLMKLLNSPIYTVRRLTAKSIELIYPFQMISDYVLGTSNVPENFLHGLLLLVKFCKNRLPSDKSCDDQLLTLQQHFMNISEQRHYSFIVKSLYEELFWKNEGNFVEKVKETIQIINEDRTAPGAFLWANTVIENCITYCVSTDIPSVIKQLLDMSDVELYCNLILKRLKSDKDITGAVLGEVAMILTENTKKYSHGGIWKILYEICSYTEITFENSFLSDVSDYLKAHDYTIPCKIRYIIPFIAKAFITNGHNTLCDISKFSKRILSLTDYELVEVDLRHMAAIANNFVGSAIVTLPYNVRVNLLKSALNLLQDNEEEIRIEAARFYSNVTNSRFIYQPYICLQNILDYKFLHKILSEGVMEFINDLESIDEMNVRREDKSYNPFVIETRNIFAEPRTFAHYVQNLKLKALEVQNCRG